MLKNNKKCVSNECACSNEHRNDDDDSSSSNSQKIHGDYNVTIDNNKYSETKNKSNVNNNIDNVLEALNERKKDAHEFMKYL